MSKQDERSPFKGIYSKAEEDTVYFELSSKDPIYGLVFKTMVETGITFKRLTELKTCEVIGHDTLRYASRLGYEREMPMSKELQQALSSYAYETKKQDDEIYFTGKRNNSPLHPATISQILIAVSDKCGIEPYLTTTSLHMTFVYHLIQRDGNCNRAKQYLHASTDKDVYEYLKLPMPSSALNRCPSPDRLEITPDLIVRISDTTSATLFRALIELQKGELSMETSQRLLHYLSIIDHANTEYNGTVKPPS